MKPEEIITSLRSIKPFARGINLKTVQAAIDHIDKYRWWSVRERLPLDLDTPRLWEDVDGVISYTSFPHTKEFDRTLWVRLHYVLWADVQPLPGGED